jgi:hypothetical protein
MQAWLNDWMETFPEDDDDADFDVFRQESDRRVEAKHQEDEPTD